MMNERTPKIMDLIAILGPAKEEDMQIHNQITPAHIMDPQ